MSQQEMKYTQAVFTWTRITFRKTFRNVIQNVIGIVIWTTCVHMGYKCLSNHDQDLRTASDVLLLLRSPCTLIDPCAYVWLQRAFLKIHTHESRSETALRLHGLESGFLGGSRSKTPFFRISKRVSKAWFETALFTWAKIRLSNQEKAESRFETSFGTWF